MKVLNRIMGIGSFIITICISCNSQWKEINRPQSHHQFVFIDFANFADGCLFSEDGVYAMTTDRGMNWNIDSIAFNGKISQIKYFGKRKCWIVVDSTYYKSSLLFTLNGSEWTQRYIPDSLWTKGNSFGFATERKIFITQMKSIIFSDDGGLNWKYNLLLNKGGLSNTIDFADSLTGIAAFWSDDAGGATVGCFSLRTTNSGETWDTLSKGTSHYAVHFYNPRCGYILWGYTIMDALYSVSGIALTNDGGKTYESLQTRGPGVMNYYTPLCGVKFENSIKFILSTDAYLVESTDSLFIIVQHSTAGEKILAFESISENYNWILTSGNRIFRSTIVPVDVKGRNRIYPDKDIVLYSNYPNPFNSTTMIAFELQRQMHVSVKVYDFLGREVAQLVYNIRSVGRHEERFDAHNLCSGIYIVRMVAGGSMVTNKVVFLK
jgi:hypothetical protein